MLILASQSQIRRQLMAAASVEVFATASGVDEKNLQSDLAGLAAPQLATHLAAAKALSVSQRHPGAIVIGCDQAIEHDGHVLHKVAELTEAHARLQCLRGTTHLLHSAVCIARAETVLWHDRHSARLTMRDFSDAFLDHYISKAGQALFDSAGCYHLEDLGLQLFDSIEGDYFAILGLPLLPLLAKLRELGEVPS